MQTNRRGQIIHRNRAQQINDFSGIRYGKITPTDIDGLIEYKDKAYILFELKYKDTELPFGQRLALERTTDNLTYQGKTTLCIISSHNIENCKKDVPVAETIVREYRYKGKRYVPTTSITTKELSDSFIHAIANGREWVF